MLATIYHNPGCSKSRETLKLLETAKVSTTIVLYLTDRLQKSDLVALLKKLNMTPFFNLMLVAGVCKDQAPKCETLKMAACYNPFIRAVCRF